MWIKFQVSFHSVFLITKLESHFPFAWGFSIPCFRQTLLDPKVNVLKSPRTKAHFLSTSGVLVFVVLAWKCWNLETESTCIKIIMQCWRFARSIIGLGHFIFFYWFIRLLVPSCFIYCDHVITGIFIWELQDPFSWKIKFKVRGMKISTYVNKKLRNKEQEPYSKIVGV